MMLMLKLMLTLLMLSSTATASGQHELQHIYLLFVRYDIHRHHSTRFHERCCVHNKTYDYIHCFNYCGGPLPLPHIMAVIVLVNRYDYIGKMTLLSM